MFDYLDTKIAKKIGLNLLNCKFRLTDDVTSVYSLFTFRSQHTNCKSICVPRPYDGEIVVFILPNEVITRMLQAK